MSQGLLTLGLADFTSLPKFSVAIFRSKNVPRPHSMALLQLRQERPSGSVARIACAHVVWVFAAMLQVLVGPTGAIEPKVLRALLRRHLLVIMDEALRSGSHVADPASDRAARRFRSLADDLGQRRVLRILFDKSSLYLPTKLAGKVVATRKFSIVERDRPKLTLVLGEEPRDSKT